MSKKLQNEIEKALKKIADSLIQFDSYLNKLKGRTTGSQRERYENDLMKEVKRLQKHRDHLQSWIDGDGRDKSTLSGFKIKIERRIELYKNYENPLKLEKLRGSHANKNEAKQKTEGRVWLKKMLDELNEQIENLDEETENLSHKKKKLRDFLEELEEKLDEVKRYLEKVMERLESNQVNFEELEEIKEGVEYFVEYNRDPEFVEDLYLFDNVLIKPPAKIPLPKKEVKKEIIIVHPVVAKKPQPVPILKKEVPQKSPVKNIKKNTKPLTPVSKKQETPKKKKMDLKNNVMFGSSFVGVDKSNDETFGSGMDNGMDSLEEIATQTKDVSFTSSVTNNKTLKYLQASLESLPNYNDCEKPKPYIPKNPYYNTPDYFPSAPSPIFNDPSIFEKMDTDTLFFIFYYQQGTYQQYLAAKQLKKQAWRYHKKYSTWFQRHDKPNVTTNDYELGTYVYFDYETGWCQRIKGGFRFEYEYLEDELPVS